MIKQTSKKKESAYETYLITTKGVASKGPPMFSSSGRICSSLKEDSAKWKENNSKLTNRHGVTLTGTWKIPRPNEKGTIQNTDTVNNRCKWKLNDTTSTLSNKYGITLAGNWTIPSPIGT